ncbi:MAG: sulfur carrier protein ThiS [Aureispira sp.]|nr:sulfur carrier protein ThiS [Aureispira sp.]
MTIWANQQAYNYDTAPSLLQLLTDLQKQEQTGIAVAVNQQVVPKTDWEATTLKDNDKVIIITATQGG